MEREKTRFEKGPTGNVVGGGTKKLTESRGKRNPKKKGIRGGVEKAKKRPWS